ncbi:ParB family chromosome partitioning protein [Janthinobacterium sp. CAN_S7]
MNAAAMNNAIADQLTLPTVEVIPQAAASVADNAAIAEQMNLLEAPVTTVLMKGSIKGAMKQAGEDGKIAPSRDLWQVDPNKLRTIDGLNPRVETADYLAHVEATTNSMVLEGYYQDKPLAGYVAKVGDEEVIYIYDGGTRLRCALEAIKLGAKFNKVPVSVSQDGMAMEDILVAMVRSNEGRPFSAYEKSVMVKRLARCSWKQHEISERLGIKLPMVANMLLLMEAPFEIRELVATGVIAFTFAVEMITVHGVNALDKILETQAAAHAAGKVNVTKRFVPGAKFASAIKKAAPVMFSALNELQADPGFAGLSEETREKLASLLKDLEAAKAESAPGEGNAESKIA